MKGKFIIQYNYGTTFFLFFGIIFLIYIFNSQPSSLIFGMSFCVVLMYLSIKDSAYIELDNDSILFRYFLIWKFENHRYYLADIEKIEFYNNPKGLRYHNACLHIKLKNSATEIKHFVALTKSGGIEFIQALRSFGINVFELEINK